MHQKGVGASFKSLLCHLNLLWRGPALTSNFNIDLNKLEESLKNNYVGALLEEPSLVPSIHIGWFTGVWDYSSRRNDTFFWPL